jgi:hypothetical protein
LQRLADGQAPRSAGDAAADLIELARIDRHPGAAEANERRLLSRQRCKLAQSERVTADHRLPVDLQELVEPEPGGPTDRASHLGLAPHAQPRAQAARSRGRELARHDHAKTGIAQRGRALAEKGPGLGRGKLDGLGRPRRERLPERREQQGGASERREQRFLRIAKGTPQCGESRPFALPHLGCGHEQAWIVRGLQHETQRKEIPVRIR